MVVDVNQSYGGDNFAICTNIESLCSALETKIMLVVVQLYFNKKVKALLNKIWGNSQQSDPLFKKC